MEIYRRALAYFLTSYLFLLTSWCVLDGQGVGGTPLLLIGAPAGLTLLPPLPARELPTPQENPLEFYASLDGARVACSAPGTDVVLVFSHALNYQQEVVGPSLQVLLYPCDRTSIASHLASIREAGFAVVSESVSRFACRLTLTPPGALLPRMLASAEGRGRSVVLGFRRPAEAAVVEDEDEPTGKLVERSKSEVTPGLLMKKMSWYSRSGAHSTVHVLELDPVKAPVRLRLGTGSPVMRSRTKLSEMVRRSGAIAGLNAGYFAMNGNPLGLLIDRGKVIVSPIYDRTSFGVYQQRKYLFGNPEFSGRVRLPGGELVVATLNEKRNDGKVVVYTPEFGESTRTVDEGLEVAVAGGKVVAVGTNNLDIPDNGIVIAAHGGIPDLLDAVSEGDAVSFDWGVTPPWSVCDVAVGGGPRLVRDGRADVNGSEEHFDRSFCGVAAPRSAVGTTRDGHLVLVAVDGRRAPTNVGVTLNETASVMLALGCVQAMNLDGGGSTEMIVKGKVLNNPSDGREREISTAILIVPQDGEMAAAGRGAVH